MARFCDEQAVVCGEEEQVDAAGGDLGKGLVDVVAEKAGDCCIPKSLRKET